MAREINWPQAFAEVFLLVVGIGLAVLADSWNDARLELRLEAGYLESLQTDFEQTRSNIRAVIEFTVRVRDSNLAFLEALSLPRDAMSPERLRTYSEQAFYATALRPVLGTYYDMVNSGKLELLRSDSLRLELAQFAVEYTVQQTVEAEGFEQWNVLQVPYLIEHLNVVEHWGGQYNGLELPEGPVGTRDEGYWTAEFANLLAVSIISKQDILGGAEFLLVRTETILRLVAQARAVN